MSSRESIFGDIIQSQPRKPLSPRVTIPSGLTVREAREGQGGAVGEGPDRGIGTAGTGEGDGFMEPSGFGIRDEAMGMIVGGRGLKDVGIELEDDD
jgi:cyclin H